MSRLFDWLSEFLARRKGLLPLIGILLIIANLILQFLLPPGWLVSTNLLLHLGLVIAIFGLMLAWAL
jgi:membrane-bound ClpP family serine protease